MPLLLLTLLGCPYIGDELAADRYDVDGDGHAWPDDCEEGDPLAFPGATERCNDIDDDCDGDVDESPVSDGITFYADADGDGWGVESEPTEACSLPDGHSEIVGDCDDDADFAHPGAEEICNDHIDDDCDGTANDCRLAGEVPLVDATRIGHGEGGWLGYSLAAGDFDGDGAGDLVASAPLTEVGTETLGAVYLFAAPEAVLDPDAATLVLWGDGEAIYPGWSMAAVGDADGDGADDLVVSSLYPGPAYDYPGRVWVVHGGQWSGSAALSDFIVGQGESGDYLGFAVAGPGDVTGDGRPDAWLGAPTTDGGQGGAFLFSGPLTGISAADATAKVVGHDTAGYDVGAAGDTDGDGLGDLLMSAPYAATTVTSGGLVWLFQDGVPASADDAEVGMAGDTEGQVLGVMAGGVGDVDGDGLDDWAATSSGYIGGGGERGAIFVSSGAAEDWFSSSAAMATVVGTSSSADNPTRVTGAGDVDGDGLDDVIFGVPGAGWAGLLYGPIEGVFSVADADAVMLGEGGYAGAGTSVAGVGDLDRDGYDDIAVGANDTSSGTWLGAVYVLGGLGL